MKERRVAFAAIIGSAVISLGCLLIPVPADWTTGASLFYGTLLTTTLYAGLHIGTAWLFLMNLGTYKAELRRAYVAISAGIVILALSTFQVAVIAAFDWWNTPWVNYGFIMLPFIAAAILAYSGIGRLARLVSAKTFLTKPWLTLPLVTLLSVVVSLMPHVATSTPEIAFRVTIGLMAWTMWMFIAAALITALITRHIGAHYKTTMGLLTAGLSGSALVMVAVNIHALMTPSSQDIGSFWIDVVGVLAGIAYLAAGYAFAKMSEV